jgi:tRNA A-37 threonylcarbamoyl transferase component Bud32
MLDRVQKLHMNGYIHNDLKPEHFLFETNDPSSIIYLIDFGLAAPI